MMKMREATRWTRAAMLSSLVLTVGSAGCVKNPATGRPQLNLVTEKQAISMGEQAAEQVEQTIGIYNDPALQAYVSELGQRAAAASERPDLPWSFRVVDDPAVNAFALPGGKIFVTRGILAHFNNEAQLAAVLGHEIGHVTARHSVNQLSKAQLANLGLGLGAVMSETVREVAPLLGAGAQLLFLKFSRDDEREADKLGFRYMLDLSYDVREMSDVFSTLERVSQDAGDRGLPGWLSTHPDPADRRSATERRVASTAPDRLTNLAVGREAYLNKIDGMVYGKDPRNGYFVDQAFFHPGMRFTFRLPTGWQHANMARAVTGAPEAGGAGFQMNMVKGAAQSALDKFVAMQQVQQAVPTSVTTALPSASAVFSLQTQEGSIRGLVTFVTHQERTFRMLSLTTAERFASLEPAFRQIHGSFTTLSDPRYLNVEPARLAVLRVDSPTTLSALAASGSQAASAEELARLNQMEPGDRVAANQPVKLVRGRGVEGILEKLRR